MKKQEQGLGLIQTTKLAVDLVDAIEYCILATSIATDLVKKHGCDLGKIEAEITNMEVPGKVLEIPDLNLREEILWNVKWIIDSIFEKTGEMRYKCTGCGFNDKYDPREVPTSCPKCSTPNTLLSAAVAA